MVRHTDSMSKKAKQYKVWPARGHGKFVVKSTSGSEYTVTMLAKGNGNECACNCRWSSFNPHLICTHRMAVILWLESSGQRWTSFWATTDDAHRQHRHREQVQDIYITTRRQR